MKSFIDYLTYRLQKALPGQNAQLKMAPEPVNGGSIREMNPSDSATDSSVLILLFPNEDEQLELLLTLRGDEINHGGQISFPGGRAEEGERVEETALREVHEEVGIEPDKISILGTLTKLYVRHSDNHVTPVVGYMDEVPDFKLDPIEVEEAFSIELDSLINKRNLTTEIWDLKKFNYRVPYWDIHRVPLWGATAMMLNEFLEIYREFKEQD